MAGGLGLTELPHPFGGASRVRVQGRFLCRGHGHVLGGVVAIMAIAKGPAVNEMKSIAKASTAPGDAALCV